MKKDAPATRWQMRGWQKEAQEAFFAARARTWLTTATPGAGKTFYAMHTARRLFEGGVVSRVVIVAPTDHLRRQWIEAAALHGFDLRALGNDERIPVGADGCVVTYAQVALAPQVHRVRSTNEPSMVVMDEVHHAGDSKSWGSGVMDAFDTAKIRFLLTGTPFRSDDARIAHVRYEPDASGDLVSVADYTYGYGQALADRVVRPVRFATYGGTAEWEEDEGDVRHVTLGDGDISKAQEEAAWRTVLDPDGEWIPHVFSAAWGRVQDLRAGSIPDAKVIIPAADQERARAYARVWRLVTGEEPTVVLSDDKTSSEKIREFRDDPTKVAVVCVRMVTEGVDIPAAAVLVWSTTASTPLFFAQMVGRVIRARNPGERATVFLPAVSKLLGLALDMEHERLHYVTDTNSADGDDPDSGNPNDDGEDGDDDGKERRKAVARRSSAVFEDVIDTGNDTLFGIPGLLTPDQERALLENRDAENRARAKAAKEAQLREEREARRRVLASPQPVRPTPAAPSVVVGDDEAKMLRRQIAAGVNRVAGERNHTRQQVWASLYAAVPGPKNAEAPLDVLRRRLGLVDRW